MNELRFDDQVAVVTGAGRGLGRSYAKLFARRGAAVVVNDLGASLDGSVDDGSPAATVVEEITAAGGSALGNSSDVATPEGARSLVDAAIDRFGRIDIIVNNAGIVRRASVADTSVEDLAIHIGVHQLGTFNVTHAAWSTLEAQRYGRVVIIVSTAIFGIPDVLAYSTAKGGALALGKAFALAGSPSGIRVNMIAPVATTRMSTPRKAGEDARSTLQSRSDPDRVAPLVAVLAHQSCPVTSELFFASGERVARIFFGETRGYRDSAITPESIFENWSTVMDSDGFVQPLLPVGSDKIEWR